MVSWDDIYKAFDIRQGVADAVRPQAREVLSGLGDFANATSRVGNNAIDFLSSLPVTDTLKGAGRAASSLEDLLSQATEATSTINPFMAGEGFLGIGTPISKQIRDAQDEVKSQRISEELTAMLADQSLASEKDSLKEHLDNLLSHKGRKSADSDTFAAKGNDIIRGDGSAMDPSFGRISSRGGEDHTGTVKQFISAGMPEWKANAIVENMGPEAARQLLISQLIRDNSSYYQELINSAVKNSHPNEAFQALAKNLPKALERIQK